MNKRFISSCVIVFLLSHNITAMDDVPSAGKIRRTVTAATMALMLGGAAGAQDLSKPTRLVESSDERMVCPANATRLVTDAIAGRCRDDVGVRQGVCPLWGRCDTDVTQLDYHGWTPLHHAAKEGELDTVRALIECGADVTARTCDGLSPLQVAAMHGHADVAAMLVARGADINGQDRHRMNWDWYVAHCSLGDPLFLEGPCMCQRDGRGGDYRPVHMAASHGHTQMVQRLLALGADIGPQPFRDVTPLHIAANCGDAEMVRLLIAHGADPHALDCWQGLPLHGAALCGSADALAELLPYADDVDVRGHERNRTPLHHASRTGNADKVAQLLARGAAVDVTDEKRGRTPLHEAIYEEHADIVSLLLDHGAPVDGIDHEGSTPLHLAAHRGHVKTAELLLEHGATVDLSTEGKGTPLRVAAERGNEEMVLFLAEHGAAVNGRDSQQATPLHWAIEGNQLSTAATLIELGAEVNVTCLDGETPLIAAARKGRADIIELLLKNGADVGAKIISNGVTALHWATHDTTGESTRVLLEAGAEIDARTTDENGVTPLHLAAQNSAASVRLLVEHGADMSARRPDGKTPLHVAAASGWRDILEAVLSSGADVYAIDDAGKIPLAYARNIHPNSLLTLMRAMRTEDITGNVEPEELGKLLQAALGWHRLGWHSLKTAEYALACGADVNFKTGYGSWRDSTPLHVAVRHGDIEGVKLLVEYGANSSATDGKGRTPLQLAEEKGHGEIVKLLTNQANEKNLVTRLTNWLRGR